MVALGPRGKSYQKKKHPPLTQRKRGVGPRGICPATKWKDGILCAEYRGRPESTPVLVEVKEETKEVPNGKDVDTPPKKRKDSQFPIAIGNPGGVRKRQQVTAPASSKREQKSGVSAMEDGQTDDNIETRCAAGGIENSEINRR